jgi:hypothetical protein
METAAGKETINVLRRLIAYSQKIFDFSRDVIAQISDRRPEPRISTAAVVKSATVLFWARMGSINAWEQLGGARFWRSWLGESAFSADTLGRVHALLDADGLRQGIHQIDQQDDPQSSDWIWVTTLSPAQVPVERAVHMGHQRWDIGNYAFNELANEWHSDHVFKHDSAAIECFLLDLIGAERGRRSAVGPRTRTR